MHTTFTRLPVCFSDPRRAGFSLMLAFGTPEDRVYAQAGLGSSEHFAGSFGSGKQAQLQGLV